MRYSFGTVKIGPRAKSLIEKSLEKHWVSGGENVKLFEKTFAETFSYKEAVAVSSGTAACYTAVASLHEFGADWGDEIIVPALSFVATSNAVRAAGFKPVFVDVKKETLNIDASKIEEKITKKTKGMMVVHTMGKPCEMDEVLEVAQKHHLKVIEDSCEAHGAKYKNQIVGGMGNSGAFSFYAAHIICSGEGGMVSTNDPEMAPILRSVRSHGRPDGTDYFQFDRFGFNCKMNDLEAAVGIEGIENFQNIFDLRKKNLNTLLSQMKSLEEYFYLLQEEKYEVVSPHAFPLVVREDVNLDASHLSNYLMEQGVQVKTLFGSLPTQHRAFQSLGHKLGEFPNSEYIGKKGLHFGCHQYLTPSDLDFVTDLVTGYVKKYI